MSKYQSTLATLAQFDLQVVAKLPPSVTPDYLLQVVAISLVMKRDEPAADKTMRECPL